MTKFLNWLGDTFFAPAPRPVDERKANPETAKWIAAQWRIIP